MMAHLLEKLTDRFIDNGIIRSEDKELYTYGLQQGIIMIVNIFTTVLIGFLFGIVWQSIVFMLSYFPLCSFAGGYHAKTQLRCYLLSIVLTSAVFWAIKFIPWTNFMIWNLTLASGMIILTLSPVEDNHKPLDEKEVHVYQKWTIGLLLTNLCFIFLAMSFKINLLGVSQLEYL